MYCQWEVERWRTAISDAPSQHVILDSLIDDSSLKLNIEIATESENQLYLISNSTFAGYRNILEEYRTTLWDHLKKHSPECGNTFIVKNSPWLETLRASEYFLDVHCAEAKHYVIVTADDVIEVLSNEMPVIELLRSETITQSQADAV